MLCELVIDTLVGAVDPPCMGKIFDGIGSSLLKNSSPGKYLFPHPDVSGEEFGGVIYLL